jgi:hypothetical protein
VHSACKDRGFDLETTARVAEFKFIEWKGGRKMFARISFSKTFTCWRRRTRPKLKQLYVLGMGLALL